MAARLAAAAMRPGRLIRAMRMLREIEAGDGHGQVERATSAPVRSAVTYDVSGVARMGDLYRPATEAKAGIVLVPGVARLGKDDPRVVALATAFARIGSEVLVPEISGFRELRVSEEDSVIIADGLAAFSRHRAAQGGRTLGLVAVSFAVGPSVLALLSPAGATCHYVLAIGGYYDIEAVVTFVTTGCDRNRRGGGWRRRELDPYAKWVFANSVADLLDNPDDRAVLETLARRRLDNPAADVSGLVSVLREGGAAVWELLGNDNPDRVPGLLGALSTGVRERIAALDLKQRDLSGLRQKFIVVHGLDDPLMPESGSEALASAVPDADLFVLRSLQHVDPGPVGLSDKLKMLVAMNAFLAEASRRRPVDPVDIESPFRSPARS